MIITMRTVKKNSYNVNNYVFNSVFLQVARSGGLPHCWSDQLARTSQRGPWMSGHHGYIVLQISVERKTGGHVVSTGLSSTSAPIFQLDERQVACKTLWTVLPCPLWPKGLLEWRLSVRHLGLIAHKLIFVLVTVCNASVFVRRSMHVGSLGPRPIFF